MFIFLRQRIIDYVFRLLSLPSPAIQIRQQQIKIRGKQTQIQMNRKRTLKMRLFPILPTGWLAVYSSLVRFLASKHDSHGVSKNHLNGNGCDRRKVEQCKTVASTSYVPHICHVRRLR